MRILYAIAAILMVVTLWQVWSMHQVYQFLDAGSQTRAMGAASKDAKVTIIAFIDYSTPPSRNFNPLLMQAIHDNPDLRVIFQPLPQDNDQARKAARVALAAGRAGGYQNLHEQMMRTERPMTDSVIRELAESAGLDADALVADTESTQTVQDLFTVVAASIKLKVKATPALIFNRKTVFIPYKGLPSMPELQSMIDAARS